MTVYHSLILAMLFVFKKRYLYKNDLFIMTNIFPSTINMDNIKMCTYIYLKAVHINVH